MRTVIQSVLLALLWLSPSCTTISAASHNPSSSEVSDPVFPVSKIKVEQGYQTTGRGNKNSVLLKITVPATDAPQQLQSVTVSLKGDTRRNISSVKIYRSLQTNFPADAHPTLAGQSSPKSSLLKVPLSGILTSNSPFYLYITVDVKAKATLGTCLDATIEQMEIGSKTYTLHADPSYAQRVYEVQRFLGMPDTYGSHYYRIPAMAVAKDGSVIVAYDKRYDNLGDAGAHRIDLVARRSADGGRTWSDPVTIAEGKGTGGFSNGFGDPALAVTQKGRIICISCAGDKNFWSGQKDVAMIYSDDNGRSWSKPVNITDYHLNNEVDSVKNKLCSSGFFVTSGRGILTADGRVMFAANYRMKDGRIKEYVIYSDDEGQTWTLDSHLAYMGADESKLVELNDGRLMVSVRQNGSRGFNITQGRNLHWGTQYRNSQINGAACNADILYYDRGRKMMLHTIPATIPTLQRACLQLLISNDEGQTWTVADTLQAGAASYSTMERLPDGSLAIFYEDESNGVDNWTLNYITLTRHQMDVLLRRSRQ